MRQLTKSSQFRKDLARVQASGTARLEEIQDVIDLLAGDSALPASLRDHPLSGKWKAIHARDCHIKPNLLLVYAKPDDELSLLRLGSHSEIFDL